MGDDIPKFPLPLIWGAWEGEGKSARRGQAVSHRLGRTDGRSAPGRQSRCTDLGRRLGTNTASAQGHLEKHNKGDKEEEEEEGGGRRRLHPPWLRHLVSCTKAGSKAATPARAEAEVAKPTASILPSQGMGPSPGPQGCLSRGCRLQKRARISR